MKKYINGQYIEMTEEEILQMKEEQKKCEAQERHRPLNQDEVFSLLAKAQINTIEVDDQTSL